MEVKVEERTSIAQNTKESVSNEQEQDRKSSKSSSIEIQSTAEPNSATLLSPQEVASPIKYFNDQAINKIAIFNLKQSLFIVHEFLKSQQLEKSTGMKRIVSQCASVNKLQSQKFTSLQDMAGFTSSQQVQQKQHINLKLVSSSFQLPDVKLKTTDPRLSADTVYTGNNIVAIADGVSQWKQFNINPKYFGEILIQTACEYIEEQLQNQDLNEFEELGKCAFKEGVQNNTCSGSATALIIYLKNKHLYVNSLGDVQVAIYRPVHIEEQSRKFQQIYKSQTQIVAFNSPQQFIKLPSASFVQMLGFKQKQALQSLISKFKETDKLVPIEDGLYEKIKVRAGDVIVTGCDGLWDNLFDNEILDILAQHQSESIQKFEENASKHLAQSASEFSKSKERISPFAEEARKVRLTYVGGKPDDISVVVSTVQVDQL